MIWNGLSERGGVLCLFSRACASYLIEVVIMRQIQYLATNEQTPNVYQNLGFVSFTLSHDPSSLEGQPYNLPVVPLLVKDGPSSNISATIDSDKLSGNDGKCTISAVVPLVRLVRYSSTLRALTKGKATYEMAFLGFSKVSPERQKEILIGLGRLQAFVFVLL